MKFLLVLSALVAVALADSDTIFKASYYPTSARPIETNPALRVVNGQNAARNQFPYQISLQRRGIFSFSHICGGSIIAPNWILTAAHCVFGANPANFQVVAGILMLNDQHIAGQQTRSVAQIINHAGYPGGSQVAPHDISLLRLASDLHYANNVQPIRLPSRNHVSQGDAFLSGWGLTRTGGSIPNTLQFVGVPIIRERECKAILDRFLGVHGNPFSVDSNICSGIRHGGESACQGDSGGPLAQGDLLLGVVSWGLTPCGSLNSPSVYARTSAYAQWIEQKTNGQVRPGF